MCFHNMERKQLQALCKKHKIPANLSNLDMANRLKEYFKEKEKPPIQEQQDDKITSETECTNMVIDFHSMKRKELQALCQKHKIPANLPNLEMGKRLTEFFKEKVKSPIQGPINVLDKIAKEADSTNMVMNFHSMKRKNLQALCQKHNIPANLSNLEMAKRLTEFFKENEKPSIQGIINEQDENASETESTDLAMTRKVKKVRFSPEHELFEFTRSPELKRSRRNSVSVKPSKLSVETIGNGLTSSENVDGQCRVMWFRESKLTDGHVNETKIGKNGVKFDKQKNNVSTIEKTGNGGVTGRVLGSKEKKLADDNVKNATKRGKMKIEDENALDDVDDKKTVEEIVMKTKRARRAVEIVDKSPLVSGEADGNRVITRRSFRNKVVLEKSEVAEVHRGIEPHIMKRVPEKNEATEVHRAIEPHIMKRIPKKNEAAEVHGVTEPHVVVRRSKRNANTDSQVLIDDTRKHENDMVKGSRKSAKLLAEDDAKGEMDGGVIRIEESVKLEVRRSDRRKSVIALPEKGRNGELKTEMENMRISVPQIVIAGGVSKIEKKVPQLIMRQSRRKTTILDSVASVEKLDTDVAIENCETEKYLSPRRSRRVASVYKSLENKDELGGDNIIKQKNEPRKRKRGPILEGSVVKTNDVWSSLKQSMEEIRNEKSVSIVEPQLSKSERAEFSGGTDIRNKNMTSDVRLGESNRKTFREEQDVSVTEIAEANFVDRNEFLNSLENATFRIAELETHFADSEKQFSASNTEDAKKADLFDFDVQDIVEQDITDIDKNQSEAQLFSPIEDSEAHVDTIDNQIIEEGSNVSGNEGFAESRFAADSTLPADLVDHVCEVGGVSVQENPNSIEIGEANVITSATACCHNVVDHIEASNGISVDNNDDTGEVGAPELCVDPEVTEADVAADRAGDVQAISVQNVDHLEAFNSNFDDKKEDGATEAGEVGTPESHERFIEHTDSKSALQLKETSGKMGNIKGDSAEIEIGGCLKEHKIANDEANEFGVADLIENVDHLEASNSNFDDRKTHGASSEAGEVGTPESCGESALQLKETSSGKMRGIEGEIDKGGCLKEQKVVSDEDDVFGVADLFAGERSVGISSQDRGIVYSDKKLMDKECLAISPKTTSPNVTNICPERDLEVEYTGTGDESRMDKEYLAISPKTTSPNVTYICPERDLEAGEVGTPESRESALQLNEMSSGKMRSIEGDNAENEKGGCLKEHKVVSDEDDEFGVADLFAGERSVGISSQDREIVSGEYSAMKSDKQLMDKECLAISPETTSPNVTNIYPERDFEAEHTGTGDEIRMDKEYLAISPKTTSPNVTYICPERYLEAGEVGTHESHESALQLKEMSSGKMRSIEGDDAKNEKGGCLKEHKVVSDEDDEFGVADLFAGERSVGISSQDREIVSCEYSAMKSDKQMMDKECLAISPETNSPNVTNICPERHLEAEHTGIGDESRMDKEYLAISPKTTSPNVTYIFPERDLEAGEVGTPESRESALQLKEMSSEKMRSIEGDNAENEKGGCLKEHKVVSDEDDEFGVADLFAGERSVGISSQGRGYSAMKSDEQLMDKECLAISPKTTSPNVTNICPERDLEAEHTVTVGESCTDKSIYPDVAKTDEDGSPDCHENQEFIMSNILDVERRDEIVQQDGEILSGENSDEGFDEVDDIPIESTMCGEVEIAAVSSSLKEISPSKPHSSFKSPGIGPILSEACEIIGNESGGAIFPEKEVAIVQNNMGDGDHEIFNQADEHINEYTPIQAEQPKSPLAITTAITNTLCASERKTTGLVMCTYQARVKEITSPFVEGSNANEDGDGNCGKGKDELAEACITAVDMSMDYTVSKSGAESLCELGFHHSEDTVYHQFPNLHEKNTLIDVSEKPNDVEPSKSLTETEFSDLLEATVNDVTPTRVNDTMNRSYVNSGESVINKKVKEMEGERGNETAKTTYENAFLPTNKEVSDSVPGVDREDYQLRLLFATPIKIDSPTKIDITSSHENEFSKAGELVTECVGIAVEDSAAQMKTDENLRDAENELENSLCSSSSTDEKTNYEESNEIECVELMNTSCLGLSDASEKHLTENACDEVGQNKSGFITGENEDEGIISLRESCLFEEAADNEYGWTEENTISSSGLLRNKEVDCPKSERKMAPSSGAEFEIDADIQKYNVLENTLKLEGGEIGSFNGKKDATGTSPSFLPNDDSNEVAERKDETGDDINPYEAKNWVEKDDDSKSLPAIPDEPHCNSEVAIWKSPSAGNTHEHQSTYKDPNPITQNLDNAAEQGFSVCVSEFDEFSNLAMHTLPGDAENGDSKKSETGTSVYNSEVGQEKKCEGFEKSSTATKVQFSISECHLEQNVFDSNNDVHSASAEVTANKNCDVEKSEVGTPLLNLKGDHEKYDEGVEENSTETVVQIPNSELHLEENILDSNNGVPAAAFECKEFLKESEVDDTIKEYIDSELAFMNEVAMCEDGMKSEKLEETISPVNLQVGGYTADKSSVETESEEKIDEMLLMESVTRNSGSAGNDAFLLQKEENESEDGQISSSSPPRQLCSDMKESARTILIHGTPSKVATMVDMKENGPAYKSSNIGDFTAARPAKRKALQDVKWK